MADPPDQGPHSSSKIDGREKRSSVRHPVLETSKRLVAAIGDDFCLGYKISVAEEPRELLPWLRKGNSIEDVVRVGRWLEEAGVDYLHVSSGTAFPHPRNPAGRFPAKAVVSTTVGAEGLALTDGQEFIAADEPEAFAGAVVSLINDEPRRRALGEAGRALVVERYSWPQVAREFEAQCQHIAGHHEQEEHEITDGRADLPRERSPRYRGARFVAGVHDDAGRSRRYY